jgi:NAD-dependent DNA ligase
MASKVDIDFKKELEKYDLTTILKNPEEYAKSVNVNVGITFLKIANQFYYGSDKPIISDAVYDKIEDILKERSPKNKVWKEIRTAIDGEREKVKLPFWMGSMDKIKPGKEQIEKWSLKFPGDYVISEKLDGLSCLMTVELNSNATQVKLYTRGDGSVGQDITSLLKHIKYPKKKIQQLNKNDDGNYFAFRGELIISREKFQSKYKETKTDPRSMISGLINSKYAETDELKDIDMVMYEVIFPDEIKPSSQFEYLHNFGFKIPRNEIIKTKNITEPVLSKILPKWKYESLYEIDGLIVTQDKLQTRNTEGNPDYSRAFKMDLDEQRGIGEVEEILWEVSRHGKIIPRIKIKPLKVGLVTIQKATAFNAKYILDNKLGPGAIVNIIRSGDVIPYIESVVEDAPNGASMPDMKYKWHPGGYDIYIDEDGEDIEIKKITYFMSTLEAEGISSSTVKRYYDAGFDTVKKILEMTKEDLLKLPNTKDKLAEKQYQVMETIKTTEYPLETLMAASSVFGLGMGAKKLKLVIDMYPNIMTKKVSKNDLIKIDGFEEKSADIFLAGFDKFKEWLNDLDLKFIDPTKTEENNQGNKKGKYAGMIIVMSGFRDKNLKKEIEDNGGTVTDTISSKTSLLIAKDTSESSGKLDKALKLKIKIISLSEFIN